jgi:hypothetical protein
MKTSAATLNVLATPYTRVRQRLQLPAMHLLCDLDGTVTDPREGIVPCINHAILDLGAPSLVAGQ